MLVGNWALLHYKRPAAATGPIRRLILRTRCCDELRSERVKGCECNINSCYLCFSVLNRDFCHMVTVSFITLELEKHLLEHFNVCNDACRQTCCQTRLASRAVRRMAIPCHLKANSLLNIYPSANGEQKVVCLHVVVSQIC